ncbi:MAG: leucine--tRNA ligase [archaeon]
MVDNPIDFSKIEKKWQKKWEEEKIFETKENSKKKKYYVLEMFAYPSASGIHMGHSFNYTIGDIFARFKIMNGFNVLHPVGYDALGLPAENAAIKDGTHPEDYTNKSIQNFMKQQKGLGLTYDWSRLINTASPDYYKWDQWIFLKMFERGLAYQKTSAVNWCPGCVTVLANEQAQDGKCDRCDTPVETKHLKQWFLKITDYADELYEGVDKLDWPEKTKAMQKNWIGKSHGTEINFEINKEMWPIFTTRPDTIFGVTFMVVSAQHARLMELVTKEQKKEVEKFLKKLGSVSEKGLADMEKEGVFTGSYAINPANGTKVPVYAGNFVVADYGAGMVMAVPAHDQRDFEFAKKYGIKIKQVISGDISNSRAWTESGKLMNSGEFDDLDNEKAKAKITDWFIKKKIAKRVVNFRLRDWGISRQRYWGTPIPIIYCDKCGAVPVPEKDLPVELPKKVKFGEGNPLETNKDWIKAKCPKCGSVGRRETDTMDTFVNSSWYFLRFCDPKNDKVIFDPKKVDYWCPVDMYIGGAEHACMHLIYHRFYTKFLADLGMVKFREPTPRVFHQGMINDESGEKMSKSKGNVVEPLETMATYGVDTTRHFLVSVASPDKGFNWSYNGIQGSLRFTNRVMEYFSSAKDGKDSPEILSKLNQTIKSVTENYETVQYRKATIELKELFDLMEKSGVSKDTKERFLKILSPICPHITEELWEKMGNKGFLSLEKWPEYKEIKQKEKINIDENMISYVSEIVNKVEQKQGVNKIFIYVVPFELERIKQDKIKKAFKQEVKIFSISDKNKYDPSGRANRAVPGKPAVYLE